MFYLSVNCLKTIDRVLDIHFVCVIILQHVMSKVVWKLQTEHIILKWHKIHIDLRYLFLLEKFILKEKFVTLNGSPWDKENVNLFVIRLFPAVSLMNDLLDDINVWSHHEDDGLMLGLHHILVRQKHFLFHF